MNAVRGAMHGIFGTPWDAPVCEGATVHPTPVGTLCPPCGQPLREGDQGVVLPQVHPPAPPTLTYWHRLCILRNVLGDALTETAPTTTAEFPPHADRLSETAAALYGAPPPTHRMRLAPRRRLLLRVSALLARRRGDTTAADALEDAAAHGVADTGTGPGPRINLDDPTLFSEPEVAAYCRAAGLHDLAEALERLERHPAPEPGTGTKQERENAVLALAAANIVYQRYGEPRAIAPPETTP